MEMSFEAYVQLIDNLAGVAFQFEAGIGYGSETSKRALPIILEALEKLKVEGSGIYGAEKMAEFNTWLDQKFKEGRKYIQPLVEELRKEFGDEPQAH